MMEYGLLGNPLGHSLSPQLHRYFGDYDYRLYAVRPEEMADILRRREFRGLNVTIPYKQAAVAFCDELTARARRAGCVNTLIFRDGVLTGDNTDLFGLETMLEKGGVRPAGKKVAILGSGGTAHTARAVCDFLGAREIVVVSRRGPVDYAALYARHADSEILINTTPVGMYPRVDEQPVDLSRFSRLEGVADVIYRPSPTRLLRAAAARGVPGAGGLWMLAAQGWLSARLFLNRDIPKARMDAAYAGLRRELEEENAGAGA